MGMLQNSSTFGYDSHSSREIMRWKAVVMHSNLEQRLRKEYSYNTTAFLGKYGLYFSESYIWLQEVRRSLLQYIL